MRNHELFPANDDDEDAPDVHKICVHRVENGASVVWPYGFVPQEELRDLPAVAARCGGGRYELVARDEKRIVARRTYNIAGEPKPLDGSKPAAPSVVMPAPVAAPAGSPSWLHLVPVLTPLVLGVLQHLGSQSQAQMTLIAGMLQGKGKDADAHVQAMQSMYQANTATLANLFATFAAAGNKGSGSTGDVLKVMEFVMDRMGPAEGGEEGGEGAIDPMQIANDVLSMLERGKVLADAAPLTPEVVAAAAAANGVPVPRPRLVHPPAPPAPPARQRRPTTPAPPPAPDDEEDAGDGDGDGDGDDQGGAAS
jgi:hypothetical protein